MIPLVFLFPSVLEIANYDQLPDLIKSVWLYLIITVSGVCF